MTISKTIARAPVAALMSVPAASVDADIRIAEERGCDVEARERLLDAAMPLRHEKSSERLREGRLPAEGLSLCAFDGDRHRAALACGRRVGGRRAAARAAGRERASS